MMVKMRSCMGNVLVMTAVFALLRVINIHAHEMPAVQTDPKQGKEGDEAQLVMEGTLRGNIFKTAEPGEMSASKPKSKPSQLHRSDSIDDSIHNIPMTVHSVEGKHDEKSHTKEMPTILEPPFIPPPMSQTSTHTDGYVRGEENDNNIFDANAKNVKDGSSLDENRNINDNDNDYDNGKGGRFIVKFVDNKSLNHARRLQEDGNYVGTVISTIEKDHIQVMNLTPDEVDDWNQRDIVQYVEAGESFIYMHSTTKLQLQCNRENRCEVSSHSCARR